jgi:hypothetical protein
MLESNLKSVSLAAVAEPFLGPTAGLTFARLTQAVLRRLSSDGEDFVFNDNFDGTDCPIGTPTTTHLDFMNNMYFYHDQSLNFSWLGEDNAVTSIIDEPPVAVSLPHCLPDRAEVQRLTMFYFDHSHTLYPIIDRREFMSDLQLVLADSGYHLVQSPPTKFRLWMVLAIGSTAYSSITLTDETASRQYFEKAMTYFDQSMDYGDIVRIKLVLGFIRHSNNCEVALEAIMLQVSYSFFNQLGPSQCT